MPRPPPPSVRRCTSALFPMIHTLEREETPIRRRVHAKFRDVLVIWKQAQPTVFVPEAWPGLACG